MRRVVTRLAMVLGVGMAGAVLPSMGAFADTVPTAPLLVMGDASPTSAAFVIGDGNYQPGAQVEFWGAQWAEDNTVSGGMAPDSFKGYAVSYSTQTPGACNGSFVTDPGNKSDPPGAIPGQIQVLVTNGVVQNGDLIDGTFVDIATVAVDPGYAGNPGHAGTGTVLSLCSQSSGSSG